jgi:putative aminopeptidase FrvX
MNLLKELCETSGIPGQEERLRAIVRRELTPVVDEIKVDALGNLIAVKRKAGAPKLMIAAHMDEIGFVVSHIVSHIDDKGWVRVVGLGGHDPRNMVAQRVTLITPDGDLTGVLFPGAKPPHIATEEERKRPLRVSDFFVDLGLPAAQVKDRVRLGTPVTIQRDFVEIGECVSCKAIDDRVAIYVMIRAVQQAGQFGFETYAVATVQEEVGLRGALTSAFGIEPDVGIAIDVTVAADIPGVLEHERVTQVGGGAAIKILDSSFIAHPKLVAFLQTLAAHRDIPWQPEILPRGGTDSGAIQRIRTGVPAGCISIPTRYLHTSVELVNRNDVAAAVDLMAAFIEEGDTVDLQLA